MTATHPLPRRRFLERCAAVLPSAGLLRSTARGAARSRPSIVLILADDVGTEYLRSYGGTAFETPHLDELCAGGMRFESCFATPLCTPSRVELLTGLYPSRTGWRRMLNASDSPYLDPGLRTFGHVLAKAGYVTGFAGKWQLGHFRVVPHHIEACGFLESCAWYWGRSRYWEPAIWQDGKLREDVASRYGPDVFQEFALGFLERHRREPFLLYYSLVLPHEPWVPTPDSAVPPVAVRKSVPPDVRYLPDAVRYMDKQVGELVSALDALSLSERTLVLFTSDNGTPLHARVSEDGESVKGSLLGDGGRVPLIARYRGRIATGAVCHDLVDFTDVCPTLAALAGLPPLSEPTPDGRSILPLFFGEPAPPRPFVCVQSGDEGYVRDRCFKLYYDGRMYDVKADPREAWPLETGGADLREAREKLEAAAALTRSSSGSPTRRRKGQIVVPA